MSSSVSVPGQLRLGGCHSRDQPPGELDRVVWPRIRGSLTVDPRPASGREQGTAGRGRSRASRTRIPIRATSVIAADRAFGALGGMSARWLRCLLGGRTPCVVLNGGDEGTDVV